jgi:hypothetical protein
MFAELKSMRKRIVLLSLLATILVGSCKNDFQLTAPWKEVPVVYAILSSYDTATYIRVEKAFLDPVKSALDVAQIADSLYYPDNAINVFLQRTDSVAWKVKLVRVDGNKEGFVRSPGIFSTQPNWLYKLKTAGSTKLIGGKQYKLVIQRTDGKADITAVTTVPRTFQFSNPDPTDAKLAFKDSTKTSIEWSADENATYFSVKYIIRYREAKANGMVVSHKAFTWNLSNNVKRGTVSTDFFHVKFFESSYEVDGLDFYKILADSISPSSDLYRYFESGEIVLEGGGSEIETYKLTQEANAGITGSEILNTYSNLSEGFGIFTAKSRTNLPGVRITPYTVDQMKLNPLTKPLNFTY